MHAHAVGANYPFALFTPHVVGTAEEDRKSGDGKKEMRRIQQLKTATISTWYGICLHSICHRRRTSEPALLNNRGGSISRAQTQRRRVAFQRGNDMVFSTFFIRDFAQQSHDGKLPRAPIVNCTSQANHNLQEGYISN